MPDNFDYDLAVIGAGPGGYVCALRAAQLGLKVICIDKRMTPGGTCLNVGCIPSKALLHATERLEEAKNEFESLGIEADNLRFNLARMMERKNKVVSDTVKGVGFLFKKNNVTARTGEATITAPGKLHVNGEKLTARHIVIASGSAPISLPNIEIDEQTIVSSTGALSLPKVPERLVVIGAGVIGVELGSVWQRLGANVTVVEYADHIAPGFDRGLSKQFQRSLTKQGLKFRLSTKVTGAEKTPGGVKISMQPAAGGDTETLEADVVLVAVGRRPITQGLGLEALGIALDKNGRIATDAHYKTNVDDIYAVGDVIPGLMLAHKAEEEGLALAEQLAGHAAHVRYDAIPSVIYTQPEFAMVGRTEEALKADGVEYRAGSFPFMANARARAIACTDGAVKVLSCAKTDKILGVHILGPCAGELIAEATLAMEFGASAEDVARTCHAHPTLSEAVKEAAMAAYDMPLHI
ncbi:dihydrolipoyl dehydrogenase [Kozakia baliensis]|uniref:dihydrolipoyl dehydrogenase n=1 Tax=Kozakia baliensis TaxID=153496 RepID=UPI00345C1E79